MKVIALALLTFAIAGCGAGMSSGSGGTTNSGAAGSGDTMTAAPEASPVSGAGHHRHHRHRHHRSGTDGTAAAAAGGSAAGASGAAVAAASPGGSWPCNVGQFEQDQQKLASGAAEGDQEVDVCGTVTRVLPAKDTRSGEHGYYFIQVAPGDSIEVVSDLGEMDAPSWPWVKVGDYSYVQGRYYYDSASSQGIDWTHHGTSRSWPSAGYVVIDGTEYQ
jgi:hypothetical protein